MTSDPHTIPADVTNPGQFYACCGLLELATALHPAEAATGHFAGDVFVLNVRIADVLERLVAAPIEVLPLAEGSARIRGGAAHKNAPVRVADAVLLDWWLDDASSDFKTWAGGMSAPDSAKAFHAALHGQDLAGAPFDFTAASEAASFCFDCRLGGDAIDSGGAGRGLTRLTYPVVDLLAYVGLQRFRPAGAGRRLKFYARWDRPLPAALAAAVAAGCVPSLAADLYRFRLRPRDASFRYKSFGRAEASSFKEFV